MNQRRLFVFALGAGLTGHPALLRAQTSTGSMRRVGVLAPSTRAKEEITLKPFFEEMRQLGWVEGQNIVYDRIYADDQQQTLPRLAAEMVARKPELIYAPPAAAAVAAKQATQSIPIVFATSGDPVRVGLVKSLAHPGGNVTGISSAFEGLASKRVQLLREMMPAAKRLGFLADRTAYGARLLASALEPVITAYGMTMVFAEATNPLELDAAMARLAGERVHAVFAISDLAFNQRVRLIELANRDRVPVVGQRAQVADAGGLFSYAPSLARQLRRSAQMVDKVLKGAKPADLPVEQPTTFELVINQKTAKALGIQIPQSILLRADRVIE